MRRIFAAAIFDSLALARKCGMGSNYIRASLIPPFLLMVHATMLNAKRAKDGEALGPKEMNGRLRAL